MSLNEIITRLDLLAATAEGLTSGEAAAVASYMEELGAEAADAADRR